MATKTWTVGEVLTASDQNNYAGRQQSATAEVTTSQTSASASYADLATSGPAVTITTGTAALVILGSFMSNDTAGNASFMGYAVSGASTIAASDNSCLQYESGNNGDQIEVSRIRTETGLTAGSNVFTAKYRRTGGTATFRNRTICVIPLST